ncbi:MAG: hypothetical protein K2O27_07095 [Candidatus Amulumruptor sp.]|nr:hypothetical protein [Candidatus Amulumruptor sp.]
MKALLITFDQAHYTRIIATLDHFACRGYTSWPQVNGRGSHTGEPHLGTHAWPSLASAILTMVDDEKLTPLMDALSDIDRDRPRLGLRAFAWDIIASV